MEILWAFIALHVFLQWTHQAHALCDLEVGHHDTEINLLNIDAFISCGYHCRVVEIIIGSYEHDKKADNEEGKQKL